MARKPRSKPAPSTEPPPPLKEGDVVRITESRGEGHTYIVQHCILTPGTYGHWVASIVILVGNPARDNWTRPAPGQLTEMRASELTRIGGPDDFPTG